MSESQPIQRILAQAKEKEKKYDWLAAAELHKKALDHVHKQKDFLKAGDFQERVSYCFYRAAFQAESQEEFKEGMRRAFEAYEKARGLYDKLAGEQKAGRIFRCDAMIAYMGYWLVSDAPEKKRLLGECWRLTKEALERLEEAGSALEYGETYNQLSLSAGERYCFESSFQFREELIREAVQYGERAIILLSKVSAPLELARAYVKTARYLSVFAWYFVSDLDEKDGYYGKGLGYWQKAKELSEETAFLELLSMPGEALDWTINEMVVQFGKALGYARKTKDKYLVGTALECLKYARAWAQWPLEDPDKIRAAAEELLQYAKDARHQFSLISYVSPIPQESWSGAPNGRYYWYLALAETDLNKKRDLQQKARVEYTAAVKQAESLGYPDIMKMMRQLLGSCLVHLAKTETNLEEKRKLLESADEHIKEELKIRRQLERFNYWNLGLSWINLARLRAELSQIETDIEKRKSLLEEAVSHMERGLQLCIKHSSYMVKKGDLNHMGPLGHYQNVYAEMLERLYGLTHNDEVQRRALKAFKDSAESFQKVNLVSRVAESCWKVARGYDALGEHLKAAENFNLASDNYKRAAEKIPQLKEFYHDHASYMQAWSEIEKARHHHERQKHGLAREHFEKAADLHKSLKKWGYLASNYCAWTNVADAEDLSRKEQCEEAIQAFQKAVKLFDETKRSLHNELGKIEDQDEKQMANSMFKATDMRHEYCEARIAVEEAKILDKKGDHYASSEKYGSAAETFQKLSQALESEQEQREFKLITSLSRAWQKMTRAEAEAAPALYVEASQLFEQAKEFGPTERTKMLALGHSRFCKALEAGTRFDDTRDLTHHVIATQHLESASSYYLKAGFQKASEYAKGTKLLFDAYVHMGDANNEKDLEKKAKLYAVTEKVLQTSAGSFLKAEHPEKREQVLRLLDKVKEERELAVSLSEVLHAPTIVSAMTDFSAPTPTHENPVGLERFEHADVQTNLTTSEEVIVGGEVEVRLDLVNVANESGLLVRVDDLIPPSFKVTVSPSQYSIEDGSIGMKGKKLDPLKVETVKLSLQATEPGVVNLSPQVIYVDELGKFRTGKVEPVAITVHPKLAMEFKTKAAQDVFEYLANCFVEDYMRRRLAVQKAGWRSLMQIVRDAKISRSSLYGARGRRGPAISELERRGLVEARFFPGERGRGGKIVKARISYEKETVKRLVDQKVAKRE